jgi:hypothetical protein
MLLHAVIVPPPSELAEIAHVLESFEVADPVVDPPPPRTGRFLRRRRRIAPDVPTPTATGRELDLIAPAAMNLPIAGFGNVTSGDAARLVDTMKNAAAHWAVPTVWFAGGGALEFPDDRSVWAKLDGDVDALVSVARGIVESVASRGFFVDRRRFRPWLAVATITESTSATYLERAVAALDAYRGEPWTVAWVSVTKPSFGPVRGTFEEAYRIPLAST